jgi:hypothetical protein
MGAVWARRHGLGHHEDTKATKDHEDPPGEISLDQDPLPTLPARGRELD